MERSLILLKPDALQRNLLGQIIARFENKGLKLVGLKMMKLNNALLSEHYGHHKNKPFFKDLVDYMGSAPVIAIVLEGIEAIGTVRILCGPTSGRKADVGSIRGDFSMSSEHNIIHASDSIDAATDEIKRFFKEEEIFEYQKMDLGAIYGHEELN